MKYLTTSILIIILLSTQNINCQTSTPFLFNYYDSVDVKTHNNTSLTCPWIGGLNSVQLCEINFNDDEYNDLLFFDRIGNKILPFLNISFSNDFFPTSESFMNNYRYSPEYINLFPPLSSWIITRDYNNDGKFDIFTYTVGGIKVYKNVTSSSELQFEQVTSPFLRSYYNNVYVNILATSVDYPGIVDIDGDGDLDILVFGALGSYVEYHKNYSVERYGVTDSLLFYKESNCWGHFAESEESNLIELNTCVDDKVYSSRDRHTGSTFLLFDANGDTTTDLLLGDVDYSSPCILYNADKQGDAYINDYSFAFPIEDKIELYSFPVMNLVDIDNDGVDELFVSSFDPDVYKSDGYNSLWVYDNIGSTSNPDFILTTKSFLQDEMIDMGTGAYPLLYDYDNDGLIDLFVANDGYCDSCYYVSGNLKCEYSSQISYYKNVGTKLHPEFIIMDNDFANISEYENINGLFPAFFDVDNDGDVDLICGSEEGVILLFENNDGNFVLTDHDWMNLKHLGSKNLAPFFFDFNDDGLEDLIVGNRRGNILYLENATKDGVCKFELVNDNFGNIDVRDENESWTGYSTPSAFKFHDTTYIVVGSESGRIYIYSNIDDNLEGKFDLKNDDFDTRWHGWRVSPAVAHLTSNENVDMIVGNLSGGVEYMKGKDRQDVGFRVVEKNIFSPNVYPNPTSSTVTIRANGLTNIELYDLFGRRIKTLEVEGSQITIDCSCLRTGVYIIKSNIYGRQYNNKLIISE